MQKMHKIQARGSAWAQRVWARARLGFENLGSGPPLGSGPESLVRWLGLENLQKIQARARLGLEGSGLELGSVLKI